MHKTLCCNRIGILARLRLSGLDRLGKSVPFGPAVLLTRWSYLAFGFAFVTIFLVLFESFRPKLRLRKRPLAKAVVQLKIDGPPN